MSHPLSTQSLTGLKPMETTWPSWGSPMEAGATALPDGFRGLLSPSNPLTALAVVLAITCGLIGVSGSVRVGKAKASASIDKS